MHNVHHDGYPTLRSGRAGPGCRYLEPHHTRRLSDTGPDHPRWVIGLCPTCHRRVHYGADGVAYNDKLEAKLAMIEEGA